MKPRRWVLVSTLVLLLVGTLLTGAWYLLDMPERLRLQLLSGMERAGLRDANLEQVLPRLMGLELRGLTFASADTTVHVECQRVTVTVSPVRWMLNPRQTLSLINSIRLDKPRLFWRPGSGRSTDAGFSFELDSMVGEELRRLLPTVPRIRLTDGSLVLVGQGWNLALLDHLEGLVWHSEHHLEVLVESDVPRGSLAASDTPGAESRGLKLRVDLEPESLDGEFRLDVQQLRLGSQLLPGLDRHLTGELHARASLYGRLQAGVLDSLSGGGELDAPRLKVTGLDSLLDFRAEMELDRHEFRLLSAELQCAGQTLVGQGSVDREYHLDWTLHELQLAKLASILPAGIIQSDLSGKLNLALSLRGALKSPGLRAEMDGQLVLDGVTCDAFGVRVAGGLDSLIVSNLRASGPRGTIRGSGLVKPWLSSPRTVLELNLDLPLAQGTGAASLLRADQALDLLAVLQLDSEGPRVHFTGTLGRDPVALHLIGQWRDQVLSCQFLDNSQSANGNLELSTSAGLPRLHLELAELLDPLRALLADSHPLPTHTGLSLTLDRQGSQWFLDLALQSPTASGQISGQLATSGTGALAFDGMFDGQTRFNDPLEGSVSLRLEDQRLELDSLRLLNSLVLTGGLNLATRDYRLELDSGPLPLRTLMNLLPREEAAPEMGQVTLLLAGEGNLDDPGLRGAIDYSLQLPDSSLLRWWSPLEMSMHWIHAPGGQLRLGLTDLARTEIGFAPDLSTGAGQLWLDELELSSLLPRNPYKLSGQIMGQARLRLDHGKPRLMLAELDMARPSGIGLSFDRLSVRASQLPTPDEDGRPVIQLDSLVLRRDGIEPLTLRVEGQLPTEREAEMDLNATLSGNLFQLVARENTFIEAGQGRTDAQVRITGTPANPLVLDGNLTLSNGRLDLESVFTRVRDLNLDLRLVDGELEIRRCEFHSGKGSVRIRNRPGWVTESGEELQPWQIFGTNLGVLEVQMGDRDHYLDTVIPGLMQLDWNSEVRLRGRVPGENFVLAGPFERPVVRGTIDVRNARFTFPFIVSEREPTPILLATVGFLNTIEWDLQAVPGRNCNYYKEIQGFEDVTFFDSFQGYLDRITVDVYLDRDRDPMLFRGQIDDDSFRIEGTVTSGRGDIKYLFLNFQVDELGMEFDNTSLLPIVWGTADYYVYDSGVNALPGQLDFGANSRTFFLKLVVEDEFGNQLERGRWSVISLKLEDEQGRAVEQFLPELGIDPLDPLGSFQSVLPGVVAGFLPLPLTPVESRLRRALGLDLVRISLPVLQNTAEDLLGTQKDYRTSYWNYLQGSRVTAGKELSPKYFLSWTGQLQSSSGLEVRQNVNLYQLYSLEYSVNRDLSLTGELVFDPLNENSAFKGDPRLFLRYRVDY